MSHEIPSALVWESIVSCVLGLYNARLYGISLTVADSGFGNRGLH